MQGQSVLTKNKSPHFHAHLKRAMVLQSTYVVIDHDEHGAYKVVHQDIYR